MKDLIHISSKVYNFIVITIGIALFSLIIYRSVYLGITYDEVWTFDIASQSVKDIMTAKLNFNSANNHILNSILIKPCLYFFGHHIWVLRLPNVLSYILYFVGTLILLKELTANNFIRLFGFILLHTNIYLLDFFSLARGYGLANAFEMMSITMIFLHIKNAKLKWLYLCFFFASLAVFANFTWLNYYVPLWAVLNILFLYKNKKAGNPLWTRTFINNLPPFIFSLVIISCSIVPISFLKKRNEFRWGANGWFDSFHTFAKDFNYSNSFYYGVAVQVILLILFLIACFIILKKQSHKNILIDKVAFVTLLIITIILGTSVQRNFLDIMYMDGRKATMYFVLVGIILILLLEYYSVRFPKTILIKSSAIGLYLIIHFFVFLNIHRVREWWFDENTEQVTDFVYKHPVNGERSVSVNWRLGSAMKYYNRFSYKNTIKINFADGMFFLPYNAAFFYVFEEDIQFIPPNYFLIKKYNNGAVLMKRNKEQ